MWRRLLDGGLIRDHVWQSMQCNVPVTPRGRGVGAAQHWTLMNSPPMSVNSYDSFETYTQGAEQDQQGDGDLPTYDDLAAQHSPNSRCVQQ